MTRPVVSSSERCAEAKVPAHCNTLTDSSPARELDQWQVRPSSLLPRIPPFPSLIKFAGLAILRTARSIISVDGEYRAINGLPLSDAAAEAQGCRMHSASAQRKSLCYRHTFKPHKKCNRRRCVASHRRSNGLLGRLRKISLGTTCGGPRCSEEQCDCNWKTNLHGAGQIHCLISDCLSIPLTRIV